MFPLVFGFGWGWLVACFVPYSIVFFFTSFPYVFFYTLLGKIVVIKRKKCVSKIRRWIAALPLKIHLKTIPLHFEYKVISSTYGYLKMANNVNTIAYLGGALLYVYILQAPVIKRCKRHKGIHYIWMSWIYPYRYTVNQKIKLSIRHRVALLVTDINSGSFIKIPMFDMYVFYVITIIQWEHFCLFVF